MLSSERQKLLRQFHLKKLHDNTLQVTITNPLTRNKEWEIQVYSHVQAFVFVHNYNGNTWSVSVEHPCNPRVRTEYTSSVILRVDGINASLGHNHLVKTNLEEWVLKRNWEWFDITINDS